MTNLDMDSVDLDSFHDVAEIGDKSDLEQVFNTIIAVHNLTTPLEEDVQSMQFMIHFLNRKDELKYTALHRAIFARNFDAFCFLLDKKCDVNIKCHGTPLLQLLLTTSLLPEVSLLSLLSQLRSMLSYNKFDDYCGACIAHDLIFR